MAKKLLTLLGIGAGVLLVRRELKNNPEGPVAKTLSTVANNPTVAKATESAKNKAGKVLRNQGEKVTDKVAEAVKERLFGVPPQPETVDAEVEEVVISPKEPQ